MSSCTRRELLTASVAGGILAGCTRKGPQRTVPGETLVSISRHPGYTQHLYDDLRRVLAEYRLHVAGKRVLLKPNLVEFEPARPIHTHPLVVHAALEAFRAMGAQVLIGEGPGHRRDTLDLAEAAGYFNVIPRFEEIFVDLNLDPPIEVPLRHAYSRLDAIYLAQTARSCDLLVSLPKMKTHHWAGVTLSMKNLFGTVPGGVYGWPKNLLHWAGIPECVADLYRIQPQSFAIVDGIVGMEGNGPIDGTEKPGGGGRGGPESRCSGRKLLPNHGDRSLQSQVSPIGCGRCGEFSGTYPAHRGAGRPYEVPFCALAGMGVAQSLKVPVSL